MEESEYDDSLQKLFSELDEEEAIVDAKIQLKIEEPKKESQEESQTKDIVPEEDLDISKLVVNEILSSEEERPHEIIIGENLDEIPPNPVDLTEVFDQFKFVTAEILQACRSDRQEAQDIAIMLRNKVDDAHARNADASRGYLDGLVKIIEVKAGINLTAVKMMEANAKVLAATKAGGNILINNKAIASAKDGGTDRELTDLLNEDMESELY